MSTHRHLKLEVTDGFGHTWQVDLFTDAEPGSDHEQMEGDMAALEAANVSWSIIDDGTDQ